MSSNRSTQTTNTLVSGPSGGKDFPLDEVFVFASGVNCIENLITHHIRILKKMLVIIYLDLIKIQDWIKPYLFSRFQVF